MDSAFPCIEETLKKLSDGRRALLAGLSKSMEQCGAETFR